MKSSGGGLLAYRPLVLCSNSFRHIIDQKELISRVQRLGKIITSIKKARNMGRV